MKERLQLVSLFQTGSYTVAELAEEFRVSRKTAYKWLGRFAQEGPTGLEERSRAPHRHPNATPLAVVERVLQKDAKVRLVLKEFPILGPPSVLAARAALAARAQGKYLEIHKILMTEGGSFSEEDILKAAASAGLDAERLKKDMASPEVEKILQKNHALASALNIRGTPAFIVGKRLIPGALEEADLASLVQETRAGK